MWGRLLGVGTLSVRSIVEGHVRSLAFVPQPGRARQEVYRLLQEADQRAQRRFDDPAGPEPAGHDDVSAAGPTAGAEPPAAAHAPAGGEAPAAEAPLDIPDQIRKLWDLVELGILSPAEFEEKKRDLLGRL